jgi:hypothetical protein
LNAVGKKPKSMAVKFWEMLPNSVVKIPKGRAVKFWQIPPNTVGKIPKGWYYNSNNAYKMPLNPEGMSLLTYKTIISPFQGSKTAL